ncbi:MAG: trypsin-like peptidase domain-containing protein [Gemmatimonadota bacterium]|nr:MAG: trypsin-like peptidase domain-containing protein [Gemmatimonadota bacterium]
MFGPPAFLGGAGQHDDTAAPETVEAEPSSAPGTAEGQVRRELSGLIAARQTPVVEAARRVTPSVVSVNVIRRQRVGRRSVFDDFFAPFGYEREVAGLGSGFAIARGGYVLTNAHVVQGAIEIVVSSVAGGDHPAELIGTDELSDVALLKVEAEIPVPEFGDSDGLVIGEPAIAIGNPFGYLLSNAEPTVTAGVISGTGRHILPGVFAGSVGEDQTIYADMIQTDASINPGNSGGPLVNAEGRVIGVNSAIFSRSGGSQGLGFAIPINRALRIADQLRNEGQVRRPWVGIDVGYTEADRAGRRRGASIARVAPGSPADRADLTKGMELVAVQGRPVKSPLDWEAELFNVAPGDELSLTLLDSGGDQREVRLSVEDLPSVRADRVEVLEGLELITLTPAIRAERGLHNEQGALIVGISDYVTRITGLRQGDLIYAINRRRVSSADEVAELLDYLAGRGGIRVSYEREGRGWYTSFRINTQG